MNSIPKIQPAELLKAIENAVNAKEPGESAMAHAARLAVVAGMKFDRFKKMSGEEYLRQVLKRTAGNQSEAARISGIHRNTIHRRLQDSKMDGKKPVKSTNSSTIPQPKIGAVSTRGA